VVRKHAFTLIELLVVIAIVAVLAAALLPVFIRAKAQAKASVCLGNFKQATLSTFLYSADYDDRFVLSRYSTDVAANAAADKTWVQLALPYTREFRIFKCPSDYTHRDSSDAIFDTDVVPGDTYTRFYRASMRSNIGYNYLYLSPLYGSGRQSTAIGRMNTEVADPANTILFGDSVYEVTPDGKPSGGGNYLIIPPCRYWFDGQFKRDSLRLGNNVPDNQVYTGNINWGPLPHEGDDAETMMGGLWPWHNRRLSAAFVDGHAKHTTLSQAAVGCDVRPDWEGLIYDRSRYLWDLD
jgi:prepilin-type N-terminal cleavage/methylation domain-containing protein/prepilin-type processing-associated H-X9-DG protein